MADEAKLEADKEFKNGRFQEAIQLYTTALAQNAINGTNPKHTLLSNRSAAYCALKQYDKALEDALACISCNPSFAKGHSRKGAALVGKGDLAGAIQAYKKAVSLDSSNEPAKAELARLEHEVSRGQSSYTSNQRPQESSRASQSSGNSSGWKWIDMFLLLAQIFSVASAISVVFITDQYESRYAFGRAILSALVSYVGQAVLRHGTPSLSTFKTMWSAYRGTATQADVKGIADFAMDNNTHNIFYCTLTMSAAPSIMLLMPITLENVLSIATRLKRIAPSFPPLTRPLLSLADRLLSREQEMRRIMSNGEVLILLLLVLELVTPRRNILLLILYGQLLRVRYMVNQDSRTAWSSIEARVRAILMHPRSPAVVKSTYTSFIAFITRILAPAQPPR